MNKAAMRALALLALGALNFLALGGTAAAVPLTGTLNIPGDYVSLDAAIIDLNAQGVGSGGVTLNLVAGNPQTAPAGGYVVGGAGSLVLTTSNATDTITIQGNGNTITASAALTVGALTDGIFKLVGADWVTITNFVMAENGANTVNTPAASNNMTEWGVALLYVTTADGAQNNTIQGNTISLVRTYTNTFGVYSNVRHSPTDVVTAADIVNSTTAPNSGNKVYGNTISNVNMGITFIGSATAANQDTGNDIGGASAPTGNIITNWGGAAALTAFVSNSATSYGIFVNHQKGENVSFNTLTSAAVAGTSVTFRGIYKDYTSTVPTGTFTSSITNNTVTMTSGFTTGIFEAIRSQGITTALSTATINLNSNTILNCAVTGAASSTIIVGVVNSSLPGTLSMSSNIIRGTTSTGTTGAGFTGVSNTGAVVTTINLNNNQIGNASGGAITFSAAATGALLGVSNTAGASTAALSMTGNDVRGITHSVAGTSAHTYINNTAATLSQNISTNTFTNLTVNTTGSVTFISNNVALPTGGSVTANSNSIVTAFNKTGAGGTVTIYLTTTSPSSVAGTLKSEQFNNFSNITLTGATTMAGWTDLEGATGGGSNKTIGTNTFSSWACGSSAVTVIQTNFSGNGTTVSGNTISGISGTGAITGISIGTSNGGAAESYSSNNITGLSSTGTGGTVLAITGGSTSITTNTISTNTINTLSSTGASSTITGINVSAGATNNVTGNTINTLSGSGATSPVANGIVVSSSTTANLSKNKIYDIAQTAAITTTSPAINGILISAGTTVNAFNNLVGDLRAPAASLTDAIRGISVTSATASTTYNVSYNNVYLNATSSGTNFGTTGIFHTTSATATTAALNLRDNVVTNLSTPNGTGLTVAYRRSTSTLTNYGSASNNNLLYGGAPSASRLLFHDGTTGDQALAAYKTRVSPRDAASVTENPTFLSTTGSNANFLHIDPAVPTQIEGSGVPIAGITDDFDGQVRNVTTPDIGADEGTFIFADFAGPAINYSPLLNTASVSNRSFTPVTITDASGVNGTAGTRPRVYYKRSVDANTFNDNTSGTDGWKYAEANGGSSPFDFTIDYSLIFGGGGVVLGDNIQYLVVAQDLAGTPNVGINSGTFATTPTSVNLIAANFPITGTIRSYTIANTALSGDYTVGVSLFNRAAGLNLTFERRVQKVMREFLEPGDALLQTGDKASKDVLADQLSWKRVMREVEVESWVPMSGGQEYTGDLFVKRADNPNLAPESMAGVYATITAAVADLNARGVSGPVRFLLLDATYPTETYPLTINIVNESLPNVTNTVTIKPNTGVTSTVSGASPASATFKILSNYVTIDGSNVANGTTRDLTLENTSVTTPEVVWFGSTGTTAITNGTLKNCVVRNGVNTSSAVVISDGATAGNAGFFSNMEVRNNKIERAFVGVFSTGGTVPQGGSNLTYANNELNTVGANAIRNVALYMQGVNGATVSDNIVSDLVPSNDENDVGIWMASGTINGTISGNTVSNLNYTGTLGAAPIGINVTPAIAGSNINVTRNTVTNIQTLGGTAVRGIASAAAGSGDIVIQRNTVQTVYNNNTTTFGAYGIDVAAANNFTVKNNFVSDVHFNMSGGAAFSTQFGIFGIRIGAGTGHVVADNSVNLFGLLPGTANTSLLSAALGVVLTTSTGCDIRNNVLSNTISGGTTSIAHVSAFLPSGGTSAMNLTWNRNAYFSGTTAASQGIAQAGTTAGTGFYLASNFNPNATTPATNLRAYTSTLSAAGTNDNASFATTNAAPFLSSTNLHLNPATPTQLESGGSIVTGLDDDRDGDIRFGSVGYGGTGTAPDIGADEGEFTPLFANDIAATAFIDPIIGGTKTTGVAYSPQASFTNLGTANQTNVPVRYRITGPNPSPAEVYNQTTTIPTLNATATATATFASANIAVAGTYTMYAIAELVGDQNVANDQITGTFSVITPAKTWDGGATTTAWFDALNWNPDGVPVASDNVDLTLGSPATIDVNGAGAAVCLNLTVGTNATLQLDSGSLTLGANYLQTAGTLNEQTGTLDVKGNFSRSGGTFTASSGTTILSGAATQAVSGGANHFNLIMRNGGAGNPKSLAAGTAFTVANDLTVESSAQLALSAATATTVNVGGNLNYSGVTGGANISSLTLNLTGTGKTIAGAGALRGVKPVLPDLNVREIEKSFRTDPATAKLTGEMIDGKPEIVLENTYKARRAEVDKFLETADSNARIIVYLDDVTLVRNPATFAQMSLPPSTFEMSLTVALNATYTLGDNIAIGTGRTVLINGRLSCDSFTIGGAGGVSVTSQTTPPNGSLGIGVASGGVGATVLTSGTNSYADGSTIEYNAAGAQTIHTASHPAPAMIATGGSGTKTLDGNKTITGDSGSPLAKGALRVGAGTTFADGGFTLTFTTTQFANVLVSGSYSSTGNGGISYESGPFLSNIVPVSGTTFGNLLMNFASSTSTIDLNATGTVNVSFRNIICGGTAGTGTAGGTLRVNETGTTNVTVTGDVNITPVTVTNTGGGFNGLAATTGTVTVLGNINSTSTNTTQPIFANTGTNTLIMGGTTPQTFTLAASSTMFTGSTLRINNATGVTLGSGVARNYIIAGTINFLSGNVTTGVNTLAIAATTGALTRTSGHVVGLLQKPVSSTQLSPTFEVGTGATYAPMSLVFASVTTAGNLVGTTIGGEHPTFGGTGFNPATSVNRYHRLTNSGIVFTSATATINWDPADVDPGSDPLTFACGKLDGAVWTYPTITGHTATSIDLSGLTSFSDFAEGNIGVTITDATVTEGNAGTVSANFNVTLGAPSQSVVTVNYATADGTAISANGDYVAITPPQTLTFNPNNPLTQAVSVLVNGDAITEADETFFVNLSTPVGVTFVDGQGLGTIENDDDAPAISIDDVTVTEGDAGTVLATFTLSLTNASKQVVTVDYETADGTASAINGDYVAVSPAQTATFNPGDPLTQSVSITVNGDMITEVDETFFVNLSNGSNATIVDVQGVGTIQNDDDAPSISVNDVAVTEGNAGTVLATFTVSLSSPSKDVITVKYQTANGSATAGSDYVAITPPQTLTFNPGDPLSQQVAVTVAGDVLNEANETFFLNLTNPVNAIILDDSGTGTINNDDPLPSLKINDVAIKEGNAGTSIMTFTVTLTPASGQTVTVKYATQDNTATAGSGDYVAISTPQTLTFNPGDPLTGDVEVTINGDISNEADETFFVNLTLPTNATISDNRGVGVIINDDATTAVEPPASPAVAETFVGTNFPNPFSGETTIPVGLTAASQVRVRIYDARGRLVRSFEVEKPQGVQRVQWDGSDTAGARLPSGFYVARIEAEGKFFNQPMKIVR